MSEQAEAIKQKAGTEVAFVIPDTESLGKLKELETQFSLTMKYKTKDDWAALKGQPLRAYFMGTKDIPNDKDELVLCGIFITEQECFLAAGTTLIEAVRNLPPKTAVEITYEGSKANKSSDGNTMIFDVKRLG